MKNHTIWFVVLTTLFAKGSSCLRISGCEEYKERVWKFAGSGNKRPYNYIDTDGLYKGFDIDLVTAVCEIAERECIVEVHPFTDCGTTTDDGEYVPGKGLTNRIFDACVSRAATDDRRKYFSFTTPYAYTYGHFFVLPGNPRNFDETNVAGKTIALLTGLYTDDVCLRKYNRTGAIYKVAKRIYEAVDMVKNGEADAFFGPRSQIPGLERTSGDYLCADGVGMMARKDSPLPSWWDPAFQRLVDSGRFKDICDATPKRHGRRVRCILPDHQ